MTDQSKNLLAGFALMLAAAIACVSLAIQAAPTLEHESIEQVQE